MAVMTRNGRSWSQGGMVWTARAVVGTMAAAGKGRTPLVVWKSLGLLLCRVLGLLVRRGHLRLLSAAMHRLNSQVVQVLLNAAAWPSSGRMVRSCRISPPVMPSQRSSTAAAATAATAMAAAATAAAAALAALCLVQQPPTWRLAPMQKSHRLRQQHPSAAMTLGLCQVQGDQATLLRHKAAHRQHKPCNCLLQAGLQLSCPVLEAIAGWFPQA